MINSKATIRGTAATDDYVGVVGQPSVVCWVSETIIEVNILVDWQLLYGLLVQIFTSGSQLYFLLSSSTTGSKVVKSLTTECSLTASVGFLWVVVLPSARCCVSQTFFSSDILAGQLLELVYLFKYWHRAASFICSLVSLPLDLKWLMNEGGCVP